ncbi:hypothetical protein DGG96_14445 [Legionella qingyii]|uniref:Uncharacterized protein n=1 Tax=Legionella qingyii TaxID=2184757 RepID=A0A317U121_9GAMM|nr:hypothetical protein DGG96_14445 [Legionella qingyii]
MNWSIKDPIKANVFIKKRNLGDLAVEVEPSPNQKKQLKNSCPGRGLHSLSRICEDYLTME